MLQRSHYKLWGTINQAVTTATAHQLPTGLGVNIVSILDQYACLSVLSIAHYVNVTRHSKHQQLCHSGQPTPHTVVADDRQKAGHQTPFKQLRYSMASVSQQQEAKQMSRHRSQVSGLQQCRDAMGICRQLHHVPVPLLCQQWQSTNNINQDNHKRQLKQQQQRCVHQQQGLSWFLQHKRQPQLSITAPLPYSTQHALRHISSQQQQQRASGSSLLSLPNLLSLSRVAAGPWVSYLIATHQWPLAVGLTAAAGVTDWLDGYLARRLGHTSKLGSYLDPFADKVLIGCVVSTMGYLDMVPAWLAVLVVGRDAAQISGMVWYRWHMMGRRWPGFTAFLDVDCTDSSLAGSGPLAASTGEQAADDSSGGIDPAQANAAEPAGLQQLPQIKPLMVSKVNTALVFALIAGSAAQQWQGVPGHEVLELLEYVVAGTTVVSAAWYVRLYSSGKLLPPVQHKQSGFAE